MDGTSGDVGPTLLLQRLARRRHDRAAGVGRRQRASGSAAPCGSSNDRPVSEDGELLRVRSGGLRHATAGPTTSTASGMRETTGRIARFNNSGSQVTVAILQNVYGRP